MTPHLPSGTVTFLFTDIEGSTRLWQDKPQAMAISHARRDAILREAIQANHGYIVDIVGDSFNAAFHNALDGLRAALAAQRDLLSEPWGETGALRVRMGLHTGTAQISGDGSGAKYDGYTTLASTQRVMAAAYGGEVLLTQTTQDLLQNELPEAVALRDLGEHRLKDLSAPLRLYQLVAPDLPHEFPAIKSLDALPNNLPVQVTSFIGRETEIAEIQTLLDTARLITLTGSGGTGKTRLAQQVGTDVSHSFPQGIWLIELASLTDPSQIIPAMAHVFGLQEQPFVPLVTLVTDYLRDKHVLLLLDNCEHLIQACARLADDLLHQCARLVILATSREALGIAGETVYPTPSLASVDATHLFLERARAVNPHFELNRGNAPAVATICARLDGIPLAIELAAARTKSLSPEQIAARLNDRFRLLVGGSRTAIPRQQTLRALIDWSYDLLSDQEKRLLQFASVFIGGWTLDALEAVAADPNTLEHLEQLVTKSLVVTQERETEMRYFMLETIRQYAREKLFDAQEASTARDRHFSYFNDLSEWMWDTFRSPNSLPMMNRAGDEIENFRAALEWGLENHVQENIRLAANFCVIAATLGILAEGVASADTAVQHAQAAPSVEGDAHIRRQKLIARALFAQGMVGLGLGDMPNVLEVLREAIAISRETGDKQMLGYSLGIYYVASLFQSTPDGVQAAQEGFEIFSREVNDRFGLGMAFLNMARIASSRGDESGKAKYFAEIEKMSNEMPGSFQVGMFFLGMGMEERQRGNFDRAKEILEQGLEIFNRLGNSNFKLVIRSELGHVERQTGNVTNARLIYRDTICGWQDMGNRSAIANQLECFGFLDIADERPRRAAKLFGAAEAIRSSTNSTMTDFERLEYDESLAALRPMLTDTEFNALWAEGRSMTMEQAIELAFASEPLM